MVLVTVGSTQNDFSRLFREIDRLVCSGLLREVFAQIGGSLYQPRKCHAQAFVPLEQLQKLIPEAEFVICHGGAATLNECLGFRKRVSFLIPTTRCCLVRSSEKAARQNL